MAWLAWLSYYRNRYGREWDGEVKISDEELKTEWLIYLSDKVEERKKRDWDGQYSADEQYEGVINEELFKKLYGPVQDKCLVSRIVFVC